MTRKLTTQEKRALVKEREKRKKRNAILRSAKALERRQLQRAITLRLRERASDLGVTRQPGESQADFDKRILAAYRDSSIEVVVPVKLESSWNGQEDDANA